MSPGTAFGAPETAIGSVQLMEKGYADLELCVHSIGGHSSRPFGGTSLARLSGSDRRHHARAVFRAPQQRHDRRV